MNLVCVCVCVGGGCSVFNCHVIQKNEINNLKMAKKKMKIK